ncbi:methyltransferase domain-containing protein [Sinorhizobium medicae]|nr:methyltransferase domain-containing protein [Sinorhizobium medicae]
MARGRQLQVFSSHVWCCCFLCGFSDCRARHMPRAKSSKSFEIARDVPPWQRNSMHYNLPGGRVVKSENAAKPASQTSKFLTALVANLPPVNRTLDYGCGKLRYCDPLLQTTELLSLVDSEVQISRKQTLQGNRTSIRDIFRGSNRISAFSTSEFAESPGLYDRAFCINVLSAIPVPSERRRLLAQILRKLKPSAGCLFVVKYRNSDFTRMAKLPTAEPWHDGFVLKSMRGYSFYALITPKALAGMVAQAGFQVVSHQLHLGSVYIWANRADDHQSQVMVPYDKNDLRQPTVLATA